MKYIFEYLLCTSFDLGIEKPLKKKTGIIITFHSLMADECTLCHLNRPQKPKKKVVRQIYLLSDMPISEVFFCPGKFFVVSADSKS